MGTHHARASADDNWRVVITARRKRLLRYVAVSVGAGAAVLAIRRTFVIVEVEGGSMTPTLISGDRVLVLRRATYARVNVIVLLRRPDAAEAGADVRDPDRWMVKRVAAVAGDDYPAAAVGSRPELDGATVQVGKIVVLGDNPLSLDSRQWGAVERTRVAGVVIARLRRGARARPHSLPPEG
jgi:signal peptidase I